MKEIDAQLAEFQRGAVDVIPQEELKEKLKIALKEKKPLRIKFGIDPTATDIHLGHTVLLNKARQLQNIGHHIDIVIGDFTASIGDPSGRDTTRPMIEKRAIKANAKKYTTQIFKILDKEKTTIRFNSKWFKDITIEFFLRILQYFKLAKMLERDNFAMRLKNNIPISITEILYPFFQGFDSYILHSDVEIGGTDQVFNLFMGRDMQKFLEQKTQQCIITMPLLEGLDGVKKMSKSLNNYIAINEKPEDMFGKIMSITDTLMMRYYELLSFKSIKEITLLKKQLAKKTINPKEAKMELAKEIVTRFHSEKKAENAAKLFELKFKDKMIPDNLETKVIYPTNNLIINVLKETELIKTFSEGMRLLEQGGIKINQEKISDKTYTLLDDTLYTIQVGKLKYIKIIIKNS